jgi:DNA polymerase-3 subunit delta'
MPFTHVRGQRAAVDTLLHALARGRVHHAYRFEGPDGVGKELAAMALAQALVCASGDPLGCGACDACRRATFSTERPEVPMHPDVQLVERNLYPPDVLGRSRPELQEISVDQIRKIVLQHAGFAPYEGRSRVFVVRRADELSISAANALLKTLEEPRASTHFVLLTARPERLLDTIRSRTLPVRFGPLPDDVLRDVLRARGVDGARAEAAIELAAGSASAALDLADEEASAGRDAFVQTMLEAVAARDLAPAVAAADGGDRDKAALRRDLRALGAALTRDARARAAAADDHAAALAARRYELVAEAATTLDKNASPQLTLIALVAAMRDAVA